MYWDWKLMQIQSNTRKFHSFFTSFLKFINFFCCRICTSKLKIKPNHVDIVGTSLIIVRPDSSKHGNALNAELHRLNSTIASVVVAGLLNVSRAVIAIDDARSPATYKLCVEGSGLRDVMATYGVVGKNTKSNNIWEVYSTLGELIDERLF